MRLEAIRIIDKLSVRYSEINATATEAKELLDAILDPSDQVAEMPTDWPALSPDRKDDPFLFSALVGGASYIISADYRHMRKLISFENILIGTPAEFFIWAKMHFPMEEDNLYE